MRDSINWHALTGEAIASAKGYCAGGTRLKDGTASVVAPSSEWIWDSFTDLDSDRRTVIRQSQKVEVKEEAVTWNSGPIMDAVQEALRRWYRIEAGELKRPKHGKAHPTLAGEPMMTLTGIRVSVRQMIKDLESYGEVVRSAGRRRMDRNGRAKRDENGEVMALRPVHEQPDPDAPLEPDAVVLEALAKAQIAEAFGKLMGSPLLPVHLKPFIVQCLNADMTIPELVKTGKVQRRDSAQLHKVAAAVLGLTATLDRLADREAKEKAKAAERDQKRRDGTAQAVAQDVADVRAGLVAWDSETQTHVWVGDV